MTYSVSGGTLNLAQQQQQHYTRKVPQCNHHSTAAQGTACILYSNRQPTIIQNSNKPTTSTTALTYHGNLK